MCRRTWYTIAVWLALAACGSLKSVAAAESSDEWPSVGGDPGGTRHSALTDINRENVAGLQLAWTYRTGELERKLNPSLRAKVTFEATPLVIDGVMYFSTPTARVIALDAATGKELWMHENKLSGIAYGEGALRGVSYWRPSDGKGSARIFVGTLDARLIALDAKTGQTCADFGADGTVDLAARVPNAVPRTVRGDISAGDCE